MSPSVVVALWLYDRGACAYSVELSNIIENSRMPNVAPSSAHVYLVGAGPGDAELLTLKAVKAIARATVLLVDDLVGHDVLSHASPNARIVHVGKRGGCRSTPQAFILKQMLQEAQAGEVVVRLKGGDPFIFGRGGEEVAYLESHGVQVTVINGITAGLAAVTSMNVPLTHRDHAHGVLFLTGHAKPGETETDWAQVAHAANAARWTLVIYMGVRGLMSIQEGLLQGLPSNTPVAVIQHASLPAQREVLCTLQDLVATVNLHQLASPSVIVVGDVLQGVYAARAQALFDCDLPHVTSRAA